MRKEDWVWMPHAAHFICGSRCQFHLATYVGGYVVSTVGELPAMRFDERGHMKEDGFDTLGACGRTYETMVFLAEPSGAECCPWRMRSPRSVDFAGYTDAGEATRGHMTMCAKWAKPKEES